MLLLLPQRYIFSSKSQLIPQSSQMNAGCCCYHKGTYFQANHNNISLHQGNSAVVVATTKVHIFKQITTLFLCSCFHRRCCCYHKGTYFQANHNQAFNRIILLTVVVATTKVHIFKQITTILIAYEQIYALLLLPQRYIFSSKSQPSINPNVSVICCCCYHKGTYFQANHNSSY